MVLIQAISDTHFEFHDDFGKDFIKNIPVIGDVLVVAGDLCTHNLLKQSLVALCDKFPEVVYTIGNHEFYHSSFKEVDTIMGELETGLNNLTWLNNKRVKIKDKYFIGDTLWFPEDPQNLQYRRMLADFSYIKYFEPEVYHRHNETYKFLENNIKKGDIVCTHHMPSYKCVSDKFKGSVINCFFATHCDKIIQKTEPELWISAHTHLPYDFMLYNTRLIANPYGYPHEYNEARGLFKEDFIVEV